MSGSRLEGIRAEGLTSIPGSRECEPDKDNSRAGPEESRWETRCGG